MANLQRIGHPLGALQVGGAHRSHQPEAAVVGLGNRLFLGRKATRAQHRAKDFLGPQAAVFRHIGIQRRADEPAIPVQRLAAGQALQAFFPRRGKVAGHLQPLRLAGQRPHVDLFGQWITDP
ncbi:hypothetical protein D3C71_1926220 [compost metagenome]